MAGVRLLHLTLPVLVALVFCEFFIYYLVILQCYWPQVDGPQPLRVMMVADTHLLGKRNGHWFDKLRREWQMYRSFQTAVATLHPSAVVFLGDLLDEGDFATSSDFQQYARRFKSLFSVPEEVQTYSVAGNHDIGFHYRVRDGRNTEFEHSFNSSVGVELVELNDVPFVLVNSVAMEGDGCQMCERARYKVTEIGQLLRCQQNPTDSCKRHYGHLKKYVRPVILQHFPLYRPSDDVCEGEDAATDHQQFRQRWECLSMESTQVLLQSLNPRLVVDGHTHHGCHLIHPPDIHEWTVPSFSWRNRNNPAFLLVALTADKMAVSKCFLPRESTVIFIYVCSILTAGIWVCVVRKRHRVNKRR